MIPGSMSSAPETYRQDGTPAATQAGPRDGAFATHGEQFTHHAQFVQLVIGRYARFIESIEALALRFKPLSEMNASPLEAASSNMMTNAASGDGDHDLGGAVFAGIT